MTPRILERSCCTTPSAMGFWTMMFVLFYAAGLVVRIGYLEVRTPP